jgi:hypothetical protein
MVVVRTYHSSTKRAGHVTSLYCLQLTMDAFHSALCRHPTHDQDLRWAERGTVERATQAQEVFGRRRLRSLARLLAGEGLARR